MSLKVQRMYGKVIHELCSSPYVIREMYPRRVLWTGLWSVGGRREMHDAEFWWGNPKEREHFEDLGADARIILNWIFKKKGICAMEVFS